VNRSTLEFLVQLQALDRKIIALRGKPDIPQDVRAKQDELGRLKAQEQEKLRALDDLRLSKGQTFGALELCRQRLMSAEAAKKDIKSSEVFNTTLKEIEQLKSAEQGLELKERNNEKATETLRAQLTDIQVRRQGVEREIEATASVRLTKDHETADAIAKIEAQKAEVYPKIPSQYLSLYQRLAAQRGGVAVVELRGNSCGECHMLLPAQFVNDLRRTQRIDQCQNCKRILSVLTDLRNPSEKPNPRINQ
jgi:predicted  nucleic acid-binding Zn-ribbon protein